jgi:hypothetical protein
MQELKNKIRDAPLVDGGWRGDSSGREQMDFSMNLGD